ncbi:hypothetical protein PMAYCL1PPCAC_13483, partial [Pristionchus mayeri]
LPSFPFHCSVMVGGMASLPFPISSILLSLFLSPTLLLLLVACGNGKARSVANTTSRTAMPSSVSRTSARAVTSQDTTSHLEDLAKPSPKPTPTIPSPAPKAAAAPATPPTLKKTPSSTPSRNEDRKKKQLQKTEAKRAPAATHLEPIGSDPLDDSSFNKGPVRRVDTEAHNRHATSPKNDVDPYQSWDRDESEKKPSIKVVKKARLETTQASAYSTQQTQADA